MQLRGFDRRGATAALYAATETSFNVSGVFRSADDFAVVILHDADNNFEHHSMRYLPDGDLSGMTLEMDFDYAGLQPIDSAKFESIPWRSLSFIRMDGSSGVIDLFDQAETTRVGGTYSAAEGAFTFVDGGVQGFDRVTLWYRNMAFDHIVAATPPADPVGVAIDDLVAQINGADWPAQGPPVALRAEKSGVQLKVRAARWATVDVNGATVTWTSGQKFTGLDPAGTVLLNGAAHAIQSVDSQTQITLTAPAGTLSGANFLADRGGVDGDMVRLYRLAKNSRLTTSEETVQLTGGSSAAVWRVKIDFSGLGIDQLRQCWLTLAPALADSTDYVETEWDAVFTNVTVTDPNGNRPLTIAGPGSVRYNSGDSRAEYQGAGWQIREGFFDLGRARATSGFGDRVTQRYACTQAHDVWIGVLLQPGGASASVQLDGDGVTSLSTQLFAEPPVLSLRKVRSNVAAGLHELAVSCDGNGELVYDCLVASVPGDVSDPAATFANRSAAIDYDTDATYKLPPQRVVWQLERLGMAGDVNLFEGNFFHYQRRKRAGTGHRNQYTATFTGPWSNGDAVFVNLGGIDVGKSVFPTDDGTTIARHFAYFINSTFSGVYAEHSGDVLTIHPRANLLGFDVSSRVEIGGGAIAESGSLRKGSEGIWELDPDPALKLNYGARMWLADYLAEIAAKGWTTTIAYNLEGYNPPETPADRWASRYFDGSPVRTAVGFGSEAEARVEALTDATPAVATAPAHGLETGDRVRLEGFTPAGLPNADGTWTVTVLDPDTFQLEGSTGRGDFLTSAPDSQVVRRRLLTTHLSPNPVVTDFLKAVYLETADMQSAAGLTPRLQLGEQLWWFFSDRAISISSATASAPINLFVGAHGLSTGDTAIVAGVKEVPQANGTWTITVLDADRVSLDGSDGTAAPGDTTFAQGMLTGGSMAFYDEETKAEAAALLGRPLVKFTSQDSDPATAQADADFLRDRLEDHLEAIVSHVRATHPTAVFELLYPHDVLDPSVYHTLDRPFPQGGRLNHHVSTPPVWKTQADAARRLKLEALSWGAFYRNVDRARTAMTIWKGPDFDWPETAVTYLLPWFNAGTPWQREYLTALREGPSTIVFWALDHKRLLEWRELPRPAARSRYL